MATKFPPQASGQRIDSWKGIAAFFGRDERTVKRWEKERKLPVYRVPGGRRSAVFAYVGELEEWLKGESNGLGAEDSALAETGSGPPESVESASARATTTPVRFRRFWLLARIAAWVVPLALGAWLIVFLWTGYTGSRYPALAGRHPSDGEARDLPLAADSVAVLPFINVRGNPHTDYLSDGITESLISSLAHVPRLKVRSRDSVFRFRGKDLDVQAIGNNLGVSAVVSGRVLVEGNVLEISAELTNVRDNTEIWGQHYRGSSGDLISLQKRMAGDIAQVLSSSLSSANRQRVMQQGTLDPDAYQLYLKGRYEWNKRTQPTLQAAISFFNQAIGKDPAYALAYAGLADAYSVMPNFGGNPAEDFPKSNAAARKALELDPSLARPHAVLGMNETEGDWDFVGGEAEFRKAIELDPNDATAHQWYAEKLSQQGRHDEALAEIKLAKDLDPSSLVITRVLAGTLLDAGRADEAIATCKRLALDNPTFAMAHDCLAFAYWDKRMYPQMVEEKKIYGQMTGNPQDVTFAAAMEQGYQSSGAKGAMTGAAAALEARRKNGYGSPYDIACFYAAAGDNEQAFNWLDIAYREHDRSLLGININDVQFGSMRSDPRFAQLARKVGHPKLP